MVSFLELMRLMTEEQVEQRSQRENSSLYKGGYLQMSRQRARQADQQLENHTERMEQLIAGKRVLLEPQDGRIEVATARGPSRPRQAAGTYRLTDRKDEVPDGSS